MGRKSERERVGAPHPVAGEREIGAGRAGQARQRIGRADVGEEADADLGHGELVAVAGDPMAAVKRDPDAAAHDDAVDEGHIGLRIALDADVQRVFVAPEAQRLLVTAGLAEIVEVADVAAGAEGALAGAGHDDAGHRRVVGPCVERAAKARAPCRG